MAFHPEHRLNTLATCAGYGGIELGLSFLEPALRVICYVEREAFAAANLVAKMEAGLMDEAPIWSDIATFRGNVARPFVGKVDLVTGGIPCQPFSCAGKQEGIEDERWLWPDFWRCVRDVGARILFLENVRGFVQTGLGHILSDLASAGWLAEWDLFSAREIGAPHKRERVFLLAYSGSDRREGGLGITGKQNEAKKPNDSTDRPGPLANPRGCESKGLSNKKGEKISEAGDSCTTMADTERNGRGKSPENICWRKSVSTNGCEIWPAGPGAFQYDWEEPRTIKSPVGRAINGPASRVDELRLCGGGVIPLVAAIAWHVLKKRLGNFIK